MPEQSSYIKNKISSFYIPFLWLFLITIQIKMDGQEAFLPFFRTLIFITLPFALIYFVRGFANSRGYTHRQWLIIFCVAYLLIYPVGTIFFTGFYFRNIKDAAYTISIFVILTFFIKRYFTNNTGEMNVQSLGWFIVVFAVIESIIAMAIRVGLELDFGYGVEFSQAIWLDGRLHGLLGTPSHLAPIVAVACLFLVTQSSNSNIVLVIGFLLVVLVMTGSRGALIGFIVAMGVYLLHWFQLQRLRVKTLYQVLMVMIIVAGLIVYFIESAEQALSIATRSDPSDWDKSRWVMWSSRLSEFYQYDFISLVFGMGHRMVDQTFNINVEILTSYGILYFIVFNIFYVLMLFRFFVRVLNCCDSSNLFILMMAIFCYLFAQGINYMFYQFVHFFQLFIMIMLIRYINRNAISKRSSSTRNILSARSYGARYS
jgi:hypothetical protein